MALGRLATGWIVGRVGNRHTLLGSGLLAACCSRSPRSRLLAFSVAGNLVPERAGSGRDDLRYGGFLLGLLVVGGLAEVVGLRVALRVIVVAGLAVFILSLRLREDQHSNLRPSDSCSGPYSPYARPSSWSARLVCSA